MCYLTTQINCNVLNCKPNQLITELIKADASANAEAQVSRKVAFTCMKTIFTGCLFLLVFCLFFVFSSITKQIFLPGQQASFLRSWLCSGPRYPDWCFYCSSVHSAYVRLFWRLSARERKVLKVPQPLLFCAFSSRRLRLWAVWYLVGLINESTCMSLQKGFAASVRK